MTLSVFTCLLFVLVLILRTNATTYYVWPDQRAVIDGNCSAVAGCSLSEAVSLAIPGDTIIFSWDYSGSFPPLCGTNMSFSFPGHVSSLSGLNFSCSGIGLSYCIVGTGNSLSMYNIMLNLCSYQFQNFSSVLMDNATNSLESTGMLGPIISVSGALFVLFSDCIVNLALDTCKNVSLTGISGPSSSMNSSYISITNCGSVYVNSINTGNIGNYNTWTCDSILVQNSSLYCLMLSNMHNITIRNCMLNSIVIMDSDVAIMGNCSVQLTSANVGRVVLNNSYVTGSFSGSSNVIISNCITYDGLDFYNTSLVEIDKLARYCSLHWLDGCFPSVINISNLVSEVFLSNSDVGSILVNSSNVKLHITNSTITCSSYSIPNSFSLGGGIYFGPSECELADLQQVEISSCNATIGAGAFWEYEALPSCVPSNLSTISFSNNLASIYGNDIASLPYRLMVLSAPTNVFTELPFDLQFQVIDYFGNPIPSAYFFYEVNLECSGCLLLDTDPEFTFGPGLVTFHGLQVAILNSTLEVQLTATCSLTVNRLSANIDYVMNPQVSIPLTLHCGLNQGINVSTANSGQCSPCPLYQYCFVSGDPCFDCPFLPWKESHTACVNVNDSGLVINDGYWPASSNINPSLLLTCYWEQKGICRPLICNFALNSSDLICGNGCKAGYQGWTCSECSTSYYRTNTDCRECDKTSSLGVLIIGSILILLSIGVLTYFGEQASKIYLVLELIVLLVLLLLGESDSWFVESIAVFSIIYLLLLFVKGKKAIHHTSALTKISVFFLQNVYFLIGPLLPSSLDWISTIILAVTPHVHISGLECLSSSFAPGTSVQMAFICLLPLILLFPIAMIYILRRIRLRFLPRALDGVKKRLLEELIHAAVWIVNTVHFEACLKLLSAFHCKSPYPNTPERLIDYPWISCESNTSYSSLKRIAAVGLFFYVGLWPLFVTGVLSYQVLIRKKAEEEHERQEEESELPWYLGVFQEGYRPERSWYECIWLGRRLALASILAFVDDTSNQIAAVVIVLGVCIVVQFYLKPYNSKWTNQLELLSLFSVATSYAILGVHPSPLLSWLSQFPIVLVALLIGISFLAGFWKPVSLFFKKVIQIENPQEQNENRPLLERSRLRLLSDDDAEQESLKSVNH